jgi:hypothetical protein
MEDSLSSKSDLSRLDVACGLAILLREICEKVWIYTFSGELVRVPPRHGFSLRDSIVTSQEHSGTLLGAAVKAIDGEGSDLYNLYYWAKPFDAQKLSYDRLIVITDEQSHDPIPDPRNRGYMINVASAKNGVGYGSWLHIDGWSEAIINYVREFEKLEREAFKECGSGNY